MPNQQFDELDPVLDSGVQSSTFNPATVMDLVATTAGKTRVDQLLLSNGDTVDNTMTLRIFDGAVSNDVWTITVPAGTGRGAVPPLDAVVALFGSTQNFVLIPKGFAFRALWAAAPSAGHTLSWVVKGGRF